MRKKYPFVLLELLIAFVVASLCLVPLVRTPVQLYQANCKSLEKIELQRMAEVTFAEIKELLYQQAIPWEALKAEKETAEWKLLAPVQLDSLSVKKFSRKYILWKGRTDNGPQGEEYLLAHVQIVLRPVPGQAKEELTFSQDFFLIKEPKEKIDGASQKEEKPHLKNDRLKK